jgi:crotonobetainyl-CoA:carnitine CoA-transferase CaiB-like acyl-CoA transferase
MGPGFRRDTEKGKRFRAPNDRTQKQDGWAGPLAGIRVIDRPASWPARSAPRLGDLGAEVLKIEPPGLGTRPGTSALYRRREPLLGINRNKKASSSSVQPEGADILRRLVATADILVENYRPGVMDRLGLGYDKLSAINPRLIYCAISGWPDGPLRDKPSFDIVTQALSGALGINGERGHMPVKLGVLGDMSRRVQAGGDLAALHERTQIGQAASSTSASMTASGMLGYFAQLAFITGEDPGPMGSSHPNIVPWQLSGIRRLDRHRRLSERFWGRLCEALERPDLAADPRFLTPTLRRDRDELDRLISEVTETRTVAEWEERLAIADAARAGARHLCRAATRTPRRAIWWSRPTTRPSDRCVSPAARSSFPVRRSAR